MMHLKIDQTARRSAANNALKAKADQPWAQSRRKRNLDVGIALAALPIAILLGTSAALASAVAFRSNPIFRQERRGLNGRVITVYKIRSLPPAFPVDVSKRDLDSASLSTFSRRLRTTHLDELPQLLNVLRNEMSLVGPRPMIDDVLDQLPASVRACRATVLPGITGPWQVSSMGSKSLHECPDLDIRYAAHGSLRVDLKYMWWAIARKGRDKRLPETLRSELGGPTCKCAAAHVGFNRLAVVADPVDDSPVDDADSAVPIHPIDNTNHWAITIRAVSGQRAQSGR